MFSDKCKYGVITEVYIDDENALICGEGWSIYVFMESKTQCCENTGMVVHDEAFFSMVGERLLLVEATSLSKTREELVFINFQTDRQKVALTLYNMQSGGYYGHTASILYRDTINNYFEETSESV